MSGTYCPHCMKPAAGAQCPHCGGDMSWTGQKGIDLPVGTVLNGGNGLRTYQIGAARGKGGFGITYVALETNSGRRVAVKEYFPTRCAFRNGNGVDVQTMSGQEEVFQSGMNSFLDEGKMLLSQDDLSCVVHVIDYFRANGTAYLVMEYLDGVALHAQMTRMGGRIPVSELMPRLAPLMRDIGQLHRRGVIHRDISPDNIMWMPDGTLKLMDFGSARSMENGKSMTVLMKHGFSPIEQYRSRGQGPYTDIYALSATIYYCVTGVIPPAAVERLDEDGLRSPAALGAALTVDQETALLWALSIQPSARPQSMEEFASMLYKEAPAPQPQGPGQTGFICVNPPPEQPVPGQNTAYQYGYSGQTVGQAPGRTSFGGQTAGQPNYGGQGQQGQSGGGGGKKKTPILIGGIAAAAVVLIAAVIIVMNGRNPDPTISFAPSSQAPETPGQSHSLPPVEPVLDIIPGVTEDGFRYEIIDHRYAVLTGYEGNGDAGYMPDYVELAGYKENGYAQAMWEEPDDAGRSIPVTKIADNAFAGAPMSNGTLILPLELETIGANAFRGCGDLIAVGAYSDVTTESTSFSGCDNLWFVFSYADNISGWDLPGGVRLFYAGMDTGIGPLEDLDAINDDQLFGVTEDGTRVLLDVLPQTTYIDLEDTGWICPWALDNLEYGATIDLGEDTLYPYEAFGSSYSWYAPDYTLSDMWLLTCVTADAINAARPSGAPRIEPDEDLMRAAMLGAEEYTEPHDIDYRDKAADKRWDTILDERAVRNSWCAWAAGYDYSDYQNMWEKASDYTTENYASAIAKGDYTGQYYSRIGMAAFQQPDGTYTWWGFVIIP